MENIRNDAGGEKLGGHGQNIIVVIKSTCFGVHIARGYEIGKCVDDKSTLASLRQGQKMTGNA